MSLGMSFCWLGVHHGTEPSVAQGGRLAVLSSFSVRRGDAQVQRAKDDLEQERQHSHFRMVASAVGIVSTSMTPTGMLKYS